MHFSGGEYWRWTDNSGHEADTNQLESQIINLEADIDDLEKIVVSNTINIQALDTLTQTHTAEIYELQTKDIEIETKLNRHEDRINDLEENSGGGGGEYMHTSPIRILAKWTYPNE